MSKAEFDKYAETYNQVLKDTIPEVLNEDAYFAEYKVALMAKKMAGRKPKHILDFGCGAGRGLAFLQSYFPQSHIWGYDVSLESLKTAAERTPNVTLISDWSDAKGVRFDAIIASNVFHHIPFQQRLHSLQRCYEILGKEGCMFLFEHNPYNPVTRWVFERCPFDVGAKMLSMSSAINLAKEASFSSKRCGYTLFFPRQVRFLRGIESWMRWLPLGAQYYVMMEK